MPVDNISIDLTQIIIALIGAVISTVLPVAVYLINQRIKDQQLRNVMANVVENALGVVQQSASGAVYHVRPELRGRVPAKWAPGVQYAIDHAAEAIKRFNIPPERIAEKLLAAEGKKEIESNIAVTASPATSAIVPPLAPLPPSPPGTTATDLNRAELERIQRMNQP